MTEKRFVFNEVGWIPSWKYICKYLVKLMDFVFLGVEKDGATKCATLYMKINNGPDIDALQYFSR